MGDSTDKQQYCHNVYRMNSHQEQSRLKNMSINVPRRNSLQEQPRVKNLSTKFSRRNSLQVHSHADLKRKLAQVSSITNHHREAFMRKRAKYLNYELDSRVDKYKREMNSENSEMSEHTSSTSSGSGELFQNDRTIQM